jgi:hypothetical protein
MTFQLKSFRYTHLTDGHVAVANCSGVLGHVQADGRIDDDLREWLGSFPSDVGDDLLDAVASDAALARSVLQPGCGVQIEGPAASLDARTLVERAIYERAHEQRDRDIIAAGSPGPDGAGWQNGYLQALAREGLPDGFRGMLAATSCDQRGHADLPSG